MPVDELIPDALRRAAGTLPDDLGAWHGLRERGEAVRRRRRRLASGLAAVCAVALVAVVVTLVVTDNDQRTIIATPPGTTNADVVAVQGPNNGGDALVVLSGDDGHVIRTLTKDIGITFGGVSATPDGKTIYFARLRHDLPCDRIEIARVSRDGGPVEVLGPGIHPVVSPDGSALAYVRPPASDPCGPLSEQVWRNLATAVESAFPINEIRDRVAAASFPLAWSPDGTRMLYAGASCTGTSGEAQCDNELGGSLRVLPMRSTTQPNFGAARELALDAPASGATYLPGGRILVATDQQDAQGQLHKLVVYDEAVQEQFRLQPVTTIFESREAGVLHISANSSDDVLLHYGGYLLQRWRLGDKKPETVTKDVRDMAWVPRVAEPEPITTTTSATSPVPLPSNVFVTKGHELRELDSATGDIVRVVGSVRGGSQSVSLNPSRREALIDNTIGSRCANSPAGVLSSGIARIDLSNGSLKNIDLGTNVQSGAVPIWSPDGKRLVYSEANCDGSGELVVRDFTERESDRRFVTGDEQWSTAIPIGWDADGQHVLVVQSNRDAKIPDRWLDVDTSTSGTIESRGTLVPALGNLSDLEPLGTTSRWAAVIGGLRGDGTDPRVVEYDINRGLATRELFTWTGLTDEMKVRILASDRSGRHLLLSTFVEGSSGFVLYRWSEGDAQPTKLADQIDAADW